MNNKEIIYATPEQQIEKLKSQHLIIENEKLAKERLHRYGYTNLIKGYRNPYTIIVDGKREYRSGVSFEQIFSLYLLDKNLRNAMMASMLDLEECLKEAVSDVIAKTFGTDPADYLQYRNYKNKKKRKRRFSLAGILDSLKETLKTDKDPIHYYQETYGSVPPWILFKSVYLSTIINFIDLLKDTEQAAVAEMLYVPLPFLTVEKKRMLMMDTLFLCQKYRNTAAHGGRIYDLNCAQTVRYEEIFGNAAPQTPGFSQILFLLDFLDYKEPRNRLENVLCSEVNRHCNLFPQDVTYLGQILNVDITQTTYVYVNQQSDRYHSDPYCSGIMDPVRMTLDEAVKNHFIPCKRCAKNLVLSKNP